METILRVTICFTPQFSSQRSQSQHPLDCPATPRSSDQRTQNQKCPELQPEHLNLTKMVDLHPIYVHFNSEDYDQLIQKRGGNILQPCANGQPRPTNPKVSEGSRWLKDALTCTNKKYPSWWLDVGILPSSAK